jgi:hypothetical protein
VLSALIADERRSVLTDQSASPEEADALLREAEERGLADRHPQAEAGAVAVDGLVVSWSRGQSRRTECDTNSFLQPTVHETILA